VLITFFLGYNILLISDIGEFVDLWLWESGIIPCWKLCG